MKNLLLSAFSGLLLSQCTINNSKNHITKSNNISEIQQYISKAHSDDQYLTFLKKRLTTLKNQSWMKSDLGPAMSARAVHPTPNFNQPIYTMNQALYDKLLLENNAKQLQHFVDLINDIINGKDPEENDVIIVFENNSACNLILNVRGSSHKDIAVPSKSNMYFTLDKGEYNFSCNVCDKIYASKKTISKNIILSIGT